MLSRGVHQRVVGAVGRPQNDLVLAELHRREHVRGELRPVSRTLEQGALCQHRGVDVDAAVRVREVLGEALKLVTDRRPGWQPQRQPRADERIGGEHVRSLVQLTVVERVGVLVVHCRTPSR